MPADLIIALIPAWPALGALVLGAMGLRWAQPPERAVARVATTSLLLSFASVLFAATRFFAAGFSPIDARVGKWFKAGDYGFELAFLVDATSLPVLVCAGLLLLATCRFSTNYLHREPGFHRFFVLVLAFAAGIQLLLLAGSLDLLFAGWEVVGLTSVLLVGFFHERSGPIRAAIRVLVTYRICDIGLLLGVVFLHQERHTTVFIDAFRHDAIGATSIGTSSFAVTALSLSLMVAAMGKSAQFPVGGWLPRAMEGPTASSAVFYGGLSVHAGVYLLVRTAPLYEHDLVMKAMLVVVGITTAVMASLSGQVSPDAKSSLAYATVAQVGLMFVECGLGLAPLAIVHLIAHALLRYYQFLRTPSVLQDALARRKAQVDLDSTAAAERWALISIETRRFLYRLAIERFEVEASLDRWIARPALALSARLDQIERALMHDDDDQDESAPDSTAGLSGSAALLTPITRGTVRVDRLAPRDDDDQGGDQPDGDPSSTPLPTPTPRPVARRFGGKP